MNRARGEREDTIERLRGILRRRTRGITIAELAECLHVDRRTVYRYLDELGGAAIRKGSKRPTLYTLAPE